MAWSKTHGLTAVKRRRLDPKRTGPTGRDADRTPSSGEEKIRDLTQRGAKLWQDTTDGKDDRYNGDQLKPKSQRREQSSKVESVTAGCGLCHDCTAFLGCGRRLLARGCRLSFVKSIAGTGGAVGRFCGSRRHGREPNLPMMANIANHVKNIPGPYGWALIRPFAEDTGAGPRRNRPRRCYRWDLRIEAGSGSSPRMRAGAISAARVLHSRKLRSVAMTRHDPRSLRHSLIALPGIQLDFQAIGERSQVPGDVGADRREV
jgi:hypothetical protein